MDTLFDISLQATGWLQQHYPGLESFFSFVSELGREEFYLALFPLIYWCLDKRLGKHVLYVFLLSVAANSYLKHAFRGPRPYWIDSAVGLSQEDSYGVPSGHTQLATTVYLFLAIWLRKRWAWLLAILMIIAMGMSRVYLGVHFIHDVVVGFVIALVIIGCYFVWQRIFADKFRKSILGRKLLTALLLPISVAALYGITYLAIGEADLSVAWSGFIPMSERVSVEAMATAVGTLLGIGIGLNLENSRTRFKVQGSVLQKLGRYLLGMGGAVAIWAGLKMVFPEDPLWLALSLRVFRYYLLLVWASYYAPTLFVRLRLAQAEPDPGIDLKL